MEFSAIPLLITALINNGVNSGNISFNKAIADFQSANQGLTTAPKLFTLQQFLKSALGSAASALH